MKGLVVNVLVGVGLFAGALVGGLMATGRWNHEGVANIPVLNGMFPAPPEGEAADGHGDAAKTAGADAHGAPADASTAAHDAAPTDGSHAQDPQKPQDPPLAPLKRGRSITQKDEPAGGGGHGEAPKEGHGEAPKEGHGEKPAAHGTEPPKTDHAATEHGDASHGSVPEKDFAHLSSQLKQEPDIRYSPGAYFRFDGMPAGVTPDQLNDAWKKVQEAAGELERRSKALDLREQELREFSDDIARRQTEVGKERAEVEATQRRLDERIEQFQDQIKLIKNDEIASLQKNAKSYEIFEPSKAAELIKDQWKTDAGQVEMLKMMEFMSKETVDQILAAMPNELVLDVMAKRRKISRETMPPAAPRK